MRPDPLARPRDALHKRPMYYSDNKNLIRAQGAAVAVLHSSFRTGTPPLPQSRLLVINHLWPIVGGDGCSRCCCCYPAACVPIPFNSSAGRFHKTNVLNHIPREFRGNSVPSSSSSNCRASLGWMDESGGGDNNWGTDVAPNSKE